MATMAAKEPACFVDTNILVYASDPRSPWHTEAGQFLSRAMRNGTTLVISPQILREYLSAATRSAAEPPCSPLDQALENVKRFRNLFQVVDESSATIERLADLLREVPSFGKQIHDAHIVATMLVHSVPSLLTHNVRDFARYSRFIEILPLLVP